MRALGRFGFYVLGSLTLLLGVAGCGSSSGGGSFAVAVSPGTVSLAAGGTGQLNVTATTQGGFHQQVTVTARDLPAGVTASPASLILQPGAPGTLIFSATANAVPVSATVTLTGTAGGTTETAPVVLHVTAPAKPAGDFALAVSPASQTLTAGGAGASVTLLATATGGFQGAVAVTTSGLPAGVTGSPASLTLTPGVPQNVALAAATTAAAGNATVTFTGASGSLVHPAALALTVQAAAGPAAPPSGPDITTYHYDNTRRGLNSRETTLTLANVNPRQFGLIGKYALDGKVDAQPLYVSGLLLQAGFTQTANVLYVATEHDSMYALDPATGTQYWKSSILLPGESPSDARNCGQVVPEIGITATPVIDRSYGKAGAIFVEGYSRDSGGGYHHRLHALDLATGAELAGSPTEIAATYPGAGEASVNGVNTFNPAQYVERAGMALVNGTLYMGFSSHCDIQPYQGWLMGYSEASLKQASVLDLTPNGSEGSIWMSGYGIAADAENNLYLLDANGTLDPGFTPDGFPDRGDYGNAILKISTNGGLAVSDFFEPYNTVAESATDLDLGSGGAMLLPDVKDSAGNIVQLVAGGGKDDNFYIADRNRMGKYNQGGQSNSNVYQELPGEFPNKLFAGPAYFNNSLYIAGVGGALKAFTISNARLSTGPTSQSAANFAYPGSTPSVSSNGAQNGIVWAVESGVSAPAVLHAYDAGDLRHELYNSGMAPNGRDAFGNGNKFITPVVANGMVFVGTPGGVAVFGMLAQ